MRRTVPPSAEIRASIDKLLSTVDNGGDAAHRPAKRAVTRVGASIVPIAGAVLNGPYSARGIPISVAIVGPPADAPSAPLRGSAVDRGARLICRTLSDPRHPAAQKLWTAPKPASSSQSPSSTAINMRTENVKRRVRPARTIIT